MFGVRLFLACLRLCSKLPYRVQMRMGSIAGRIIEPLVWEAVVELISNPQQIAAAWETAVEKQDATQMN